MTFPLGHQFRSALQPLFGVDHIAAGEAIFAAPVLAEFDQVGRTANSAHRPVVLILPVGVAMHEHRKVAIGERRLMVGDCVERDTRLRDDAFAVALRDGAMILDALGLKTALAHARRCGADLVLRLKVDALRFQRSVIYAGVNVEFGKAGVDMIGPTLAPLLDKFGAVPVADLLREPALADFAHGEHDMGVRLRHAVRADVPMHIQIRNHAAFDKLGLDEIAGKLDAIGLGHLARNGKLYLAGKLRVLALLGRLDVIPEAFAVAPLFGRTFWQHDLAMLDARLGAEIMVAIQPLVVQAFASPIGGCGNGAAPGSASDDFRGEVKDRHDGNPSTPPSARRHDV
ncbi:hypothetical protein FHR21_000619 [Sphingopyxis panaciterrulae]|uniref:Uncharacterized protein n=1 Tax=Sphingopyxis panaciterrulae TaxID=462372 RepID=A0A7W9B2Y8_9SPHN|nr:hypothetical protein [Sphingopyxis panaciterrulae]